MTISGVSWWRGYCSDGEGEQVDGGVSSSHSANVRGVRVLSILSASEREGFGIGEDMVVDQTIMVVG